MQNHTEPGLAGLMTRIGVPVKIGIRFRSTVVSTRLAVGRTPEDAAPFILSDQPGDACVGYGTSHSRCTFCDGLVRHVEQLWPLCTQHTYDTSERSERIWLDHSS